MTNAPKYQVMDANGFVLAIERSKAAADRAVTGLTKVLDRPVHYRTVSDN